MSVPYETMSPYARHLVDSLQLSEHPEGGWYRRDWQSPTAVHGSERPLASLIYFLLAKGDASAWHQVDADEIWLWHGPGTVTLQIAGSGEKPDESAIQEVTLGQGIVCDSSKNTDISKIDKNSVVVARNDDTGIVKTFDSTPVGHFLVPAGVWQRTLPTASDALVSCVVSPGFEFRGFTLAEQ